MIDVDKTVLNTIMTAFDKMRFLGQTNPNLFRAILEVCVLDDLIYWAAGIDGQEGVQELLRERQNYLFLHNPGFKICSVYNGEYMSANVPMPNNNDFWKRVTDAPAGPIKLTQPKVTVGGEVKKSWVEDPNYTPVVVEYTTTDAKDSGPETAVTEDGTKVFDATTATIQDKMNVYVNRTTGTVWYYDTDCTWHAIGGDTEKTNEATIRQIISEYKINYSNETGQYILTEITADENANNQIGIVSDKEIKEML